MALALSVISSQGCQSPRQFAHRPAWLAPKSAAAELERHPASRTAATSSEISAGELADEKKQPSAATTPFKLVAYNAPFQQLNANEQSPSEQTLGQSSRRSSDRPNSQVGPSLDNPARLAGATSQPAELGMSAMTLAEFESIALANNPTLRELAATTQKAAGFRTQVGLRPNPIAGYQGVQLADKSTDQHTAFVEQEIVRGGKLELNRRVLNEALRAQLLELEAQRWRVTTDIRARFYEALAAQRRIELIREFQSVTDHGLELAELRKKALEGSQIDVLQSKVQKNEIDLAYQQAQVAFDAAWRKLSALSGASYLTPTRLSGELPREVEQLNWSSVADQMINSSPERHVALARVSQARAQLERQTAQPIPNLTVQMAAGVDNGTNSGLMNLQVGAPLPVFNQNQGNIAAARGEYCRAVMEVERVENSIKARVATVSQEYDSALAAVSSYANEILPSAEQSLQLAELAYKAGETNFIQVLVARRTYFDSNLQFVVAQGQLAQARALVDGFVLSGGLDPIDDQSGDDALRGLTFGQQ